MEISFKKINIESPTPTTQCGHIQQTYLLNEYHDHLFCRALGKWKGKVAETSMIKSNY